MKILELKDISYIQGENEILSGVNLAVEQGDFISIVGPSGSGKSTFLKLCCNLVSPAKGDISYRGANILSIDAAELRKKIAYCFQTPYLFGDKVIENMAFPFSIRDEKVDMERIQSLLCSFGLEGGILEKEVKSLSGGEKQRIALIRTLMMKPEVLLLDEVTSALDVDNTLIVEKNVKVLNQEGTTVLWVTHNPEQSRRNANRLLTFESGRIKSLEVLK